jgi:hypothetical protein
MRIVPVNFNWAQSNASSLQKILEDDGGRIAINTDRFDKLITGLIQQYIMIIWYTSYNDIFDAFRLALKFYHFEERTD